MRMRFVASVLSLIVAHASAQTQNVVTQYNPALTPGDHYVIAGNDVHIIAGIAAEASRFKFEARTQQWNGSQWVDIGPGFINLIDIADGVADPGTVRIEINGNPALNHVAGATDVREIRLPRADTAASILYHVRISGNLGVDGIDDLDEFDQIGIIELLGTTVGTTFVPGNLRDNLYAANITGSIEISGDVADGMTILDGIASPASLKIKGTLNGTLQIGDDANTDVVSGRVEVGVLPTGSSIIVNGDLVDNGLTTVAGANYFWINQMTGGTFRCRNMAIRPNSSAGGPELGTHTLVIGKRSGVPDIPLLTEQSGTIEIENTLSGVLLLRTKCGNLTVNVQDIDAGVSGYPWIEYGGIWVFVPRPGLSINVSGDFRRGFITAIGDYVSTVPQTHNGRFEGTIDIAGNLGQNTVNNVAQIRADYCSPFNVNDPCLDPDNEDWPAMSLDADIRVGGHVYETNAAYPAIFAKGGLDSEILIDGSLLDRDNAPGTAADAIVIGGAMAANAAIVIDNNGWHEGDAWNPPARIRVNGTGYTANDQLPRVYEITKCRGDMNNDGVVDSDDVVPFGLTRAAYAATWHGLADSWEYHRDANGDTVVGDGAPNAADQAAFDALLVENCCVPQCPGANAYCQGDVDGDEDVDLTDLATLLTYYGSCAAPFNPVCTDLDQDGCVTLTDLSTLLANFGVGCMCGMSGFQFSGFSTPEPPVDPAFVEWAQHATLEELLEWNANWDGTNPQGGDR